MAQSQVSNFVVKSTETRTVLRFLTASKDNRLEVDSFHPTTERDQLQTLSQLSVLFNDEAKEVVIAEQVRSVSKANNDVIGVLRIPFTDMKNPSFSYAKEADTFDHDITTIAARARSFSETLLFQDSSDSTGAATASPSDQTSKDQAQRTGTMSMPRLVTQDSKNIEADIARQRFLMSEKVAAAKRRKQEEETRLDAERQDRIKINLASLLPPPTTKVPQRRTLHFMCIDSEAAAIGHIADLASVKFSEFVKGTVGGNHVMLDFETEDITMIAFQKAEESIQNFAKSMPASPQPRVEIIDDNIKAKILQSAVTRAVTGDDHFDASTLPKRLSQTQQAYRNVPAQLVGSQNDVHRLQRKVNELGMEHRASLDHYDVLQEASDALEQQQASGSPLKDAPREPERTISSSISEPHALYVAGARSEQEARSIFGREDRLQIKEIFLVPNRRSQNNFKIDLHKPELVHEVLMRVRLNIRSKYSNLHSAPKITYYPEKPRENTKPLTTEPSATTRAAPPSTFHAEQNARLSQQIVGLRADKDALERQVEEIQEQNAIGLEHTQCLEAEIRNLKQQHEAANAASQASFTEHGGIDLLGLEIGHDAGQESTLVYDTSTTIQPQPSWLELALDHVPGAYPRSDNSSNYRQDPTQNEEFTDVEHMASLKDKNTLSNDDMVLRIDNAVNAMSQAQSAALQAGKAVTVEFREPEEMTEWLEQRHQGVVNIAGSGSRRALAVLWL